MKRAPGDTDREAAAGRNWPDAQWCQDWRWKEINSPPPKKKTWFSANFTCAVCSVCLLCSHHILGIVVNMSYRIKTCFSFKPELTDYRLWLCLVRAAQMPHHCPAETNAIVYLGSCLCAWLTVCLLLMHKGHFGELLTAAIKRISCSDSDQQRRNSKTVGNL